MIDKLLFFDIETAPLPDDQILWPEFKAASNIVDPDKKQKSIDNKREKFIRDLLLQPDSSYVTAVGFKHYKNPEVTIKYVTRPEDEGELIRVMMEVFTTSVHQGRSMVAFNMPFDIGYLVQKSWDHQIPRPEFLRADSRYGISDKRLIDLRMMLTLGDKYKAGGLDYWMKRSKYPNRKAFDGSMFHEKMLKDWPTAREYLKDDVLALEHLWNWCNLFDTTLPGVNTKRGFVGRDLGVAK